ncbi:SRPBCC domain-containing protein (plasmid) [Prescottella equi]|uniref:SRPBCC family protein n=1 Tax=Rhodococcus hoagii TaxID=43767 RepID=UPI00257765CD|nr:SRPBCC domain-containing protein [Prescottella equi]WJJ14574.1 SRPBCC domain-containing protein [Prescottella equi]
MGYVSFTNRRRLEGDPEVIWRAFTHPLETAQYEDHQTETVLGPDFDMVAGHSWDNKHGEECDFDVVRWTITRHVPNEVFEFTGKQRGIRQNVVLTMEPADRGHILTETIHFRPAIDGKLGTQLLSWLLLSTGLLAKVGNDHGENLDLLEKYIATG